MGLILKPNIVVNDIKIEADINSTSVDNVINEFRNRPMIMIGDYVLGLGELLEFNFNIRLNSFPTFTISVNDQQYKIRKALKNDIDKCVIFFGWRKWYYKFNGILNKTFSDAGDAQIELTGTLFNEKIFNGEQFAFKNKTVLQILTTICSKTSLGLYTYDNSDLLKIIDYTLITGTRYIDYLDFIITTYTNNLYFIDGNYFLHVADIEKLRNLPVDKYSINWKTGEKYLVPQNIVLKSIKRDGSPEELLNDYKIPIDYYTTDTNFSDAHVSTYEEYYIGYGGNDEKLIKSREKLGIGSNKTNTFFGFKNHKFPFYKDIINKKIAGNVTKIFTQNVIFELTPFSIIDLEIYLPFTSGETGYKLDTEHSGKKIVIGFSINYKKPLDDKNELNTLNQIIEVI